jgi:hypothetical protein
VRWIGWLTTWPLLLMLIWDGTHAPAWTTGLAYGTAYYVAINSLGRCEPECLLPALLRSMPENSPDYCTSIE